MNQSKAEALYQELPFRTVVAAVPAGADLDAFRAEMQALSLDNFDFSGQFTTDPAGAPPATHLMSSGKCEQAAIDSLATDSRVTMQDLPWRDMATQLGLTRVVDPTEE